MLQPNSVLEEDAPLASHARSDSSSGQEDAAPAAPADMSDEDAKKKIADNKELFAVRNIDGA